MRVGFAGIGGCCPVSDDGLAGCKLEGFVREVVGGRAAVGVVVGKLFFILRAQVSSSSFWGPALIWFCNRWFSPAFCNSCF